MRITCAMLSCLMFPRLLGGRWLRPEVHRLSGLSLRSIEVCHGVGCLGPVGWISGARTHGPSWISGTGLVGSGQFWNAEKIPNFHMISWENPMVCFFDVRGWHQSIETRNARHFLVVSRWIQIALKYLGYDMKESSTFSGCIWIHRVLKYTLAFAWSNLLTCSCTHGNDHWVRRGGLNKESIEKCHVCLFYHLADSWWEQFTYVFNFKVIKCTLALAWVWPITCSHLYKHTNHTYCNYNNNIYIYTYN